MLFIEGAAVAAEAAAAAEAFVVAAVGRVEKCD